MSNAYPQPYPILPDDATPNPAEPNLYLLRLAAQVAKTLPAAVVTDRIAHDVLTLVSAAKAHKTNVEREHMAPTTEDYRRLRRSYVTHAQQVVNGWNEILRRAGTLKLGDGWAQGWDLEMGAMSFDVKYTDERGVPRIYYLLAND